MSSTITPSQNNNIGSSSTNNSSTSTNNNNHNNNHNNNDSHICVKDESAVPCSNIDGDNTASGIVNNQVTVNLIKDNIDTQLLATNNNPSNAMDELLGYLDETKIKTEKIHKYWENYFNNPENNILISDNGDGEVNVPDITISTPQDPQTPQGPQTPQEQLTPQELQTPQELPIPNEPQTPQQTFTQQESLTPQLTLTPQHSSTPQGTAASTTPHTPIPVNNTNYDDESVEQLMARASALMAVNQRRINRRLRYRNAVCHSNIVEIEDCPEISNNSTPPNSQSAIAAILADADDIIASVNNVIINNSSNNEESDSIIEIRNIRNGSPLLVLSDEDDDVIFVGQTAAASVIDLSETTTPPRVVSPVIDEIPDDQVVNFLLEHTRPPDHHSYLGRQSGRHINYPLVQMVAQQMEESATTSAALAVATEAVFTAVAAAEAAKAATPAKRSRSEQTNQKQINCPVCLEQPLDNRPFVTSCGHVFCEECIKKAVKLSKKCPMCNRKLSLKQMHPIYF